MAARSPTFTSSSTSVQATNSYFLGIELANEQLRAALVDDQLATVGIEIFDFDSELPEYQ
jgi:xylulokinase